MNNIQRSIGVLSRLNSNLIEHLKAALPHECFIEIKLTDSSTLNESDILISDFDLIGPHINQLKKPKWIQGTWAGLDALWPHIDKSNPPKIPITRLSGENFGSLMGEYVVSNIVFWERNYFQVRENQKKCLWDRNVCQQSDYRSIADLKIGILGIGSIGNRIGRTLNYLGAIIYGYGRRETVPLDSEEYRHITKYFTKKNLPELLSNVDYLINVLPKTDETTGLLNNEILKNCKNKNTIFINIGRSNVIKESDLIRALQEKWISGAILDVFDIEPLPAQNLLWTIPNVFITPHNSGNSRIQDIVNKFKKNLENFDSGQPLINEVDFIKGY